MRLEEDISVSSDISVAELGKRVILVLPKIAYKAEINSVVQSPIGATINVEWSAENVIESDYISIATPGDRTAGYAAFTYVKGSEALPLTLPLIPVGI